MKKIFFAILSVIVIAAAFFGLLYQHTSPNRPSDRAGKNFERYKSSFDMDSDGIDDQTDILENALNYVNKTRPKYKSRYYADTGYPDDGYGTCTDVVAFAMKDSGYDLMELVNEDVLRHKDRYDIETPDKMIDFRRVRNLKVYFENNHENLTTDMNRTEEWQGGDIVLWGGHVGVVSDRRDRNGIPYVIHHRSAFQRHYENDYIRKSKDVIVGHYRIIPKNSIRRNDIEH